jgi:hypothetical protein
MLLRHLWVVCELVVFAHAQPCTSDDCEDATWLHIPGPNPLLSGSSSKNQPDLEMAGGLITDPTDGKHYMFYHETFGDAGFTQDVATSDSLMGPFVPLVSDFSILQTNNSPLLRPSCLCEIAARA